MKKTLEGKTCFVTGGAHGIGRAAVEAFYDAGANVYFCDIDRQCGMKLAAELPGTRFFPCDVSQSVELTGVLGTVYGETDIDILINNVGIGLFSPLTETSVERFDQALATNLRPVFITAREMALRRNSAEGKRRYGRIINVSSTRYLQSEPGTECYAASKGGIVSLTHALAVSFSGYNVTVNCISPGWIDTGAYGALKPSDHAQHPSGRVGEPGDIARAFLFLADEKNDFINGQNIVIDGGMTKKMIYEE